MNNNLNAKEALIPNLSVDCTLFGFKDNQLNVLLIKQAFPKHMQSKNLAQYALPGNLVYQTESLDTAAARILEELTGVKSIYLEQSMAFGAPNRVQDVRDSAWLHLMRNEPNTRVVTIAYYGLINAEKVKLKHGGFSSEAKWMPVKELPILAFDHNIIVEKALEDLRLKIQMSPICSELLPLKFTLAQLQNVYESILDYTLDKRNFRRKIINSGILKSLNEKQLDVNYKPALYYIFNEELIKTTHQQLNLRMESNLQTC